MMSSRLGTRIPFRQRLTVRLTGGVIVVLLLIGVPFLFAFQKLLRDQQLEAFSQATTGLSRIVVDGLRSSMLAGQPHLLDDSVRNLAEQPEVERVLLLDHRGRVRVSSDPSYEGRTLDRQQDVSCRACHGGNGAGPPPSRTVVTEEAGRRIFRAMSVIPNQPQCHRCHDPAVASNGILLMDLTLNEADRRFLANIGGTAALGSVMVVLTIAVLVFLLRRMVHSPLRTVVATSQRIVDGDLDARAPVSRPGEFGLLAERVNRMTDHLARSLARVEEQHRELQEILEAVDDEIVVLDRSQRVVAANRAFRKGCGRPDGDFNGRFCREVSALRWPCAAQGASGCPVQMVFQTGRHHKGIITSPRPGGGERVVEIHASPLPGPDGTVSLAVEVRRDISERRQMEASLAQSERLASLGLLASGISHEINNPLGAIAASVEGLRRRIAAEPAALREPPDQLDQALGRIAEQVRRGRSITDRLLMVARPPGGTRTLVDVNALMQDILAILAVHIRKAGVVVRLDLAEGLPPFSGDESSLGQVILNLTLNAVQAMEEGGGEMRIASSAPDGSIRIEVEDTGCGIPPEHLGRIYEPFFTTKPPGKGTGLGLFISHRIVTDMGGTIQVRTQPGRGTRFTIGLPRRAAGDRR